MIPALLPYLKKINNFPMMLVLNSFILSVNKNIMFVNHIIYLGIRIQGFEEYELRKLR